MKKFSSSVTRRLAATSLSLLFLGGQILPFASHATETVFFTAANDSVLPLDDSTMPLWIDGQLYVPYTVFDANTTGINIGTHSTRNAAAGTATVYNLAHTLMFDLNAGNSVDQRSNLVYPYKAVLRQGIPFLPVAGVCNFFGLTYSYQNTNYGYLLRLKGNNVVLSDSRFIDAADSLLSSMLKDFQQVDLPVVTTPEPEPSPPPAPETAEEPEAPEIPPTPLVLGIHLHDHNVPLPQALGEVNAKAVFFFTPEQLETEGNTLRYVLGEGHYIGLKVTGETLEEVLEQIDRGNALLFQQARLTTQMISTQTSWQDSLRPLGFIPWMGGDPLPFTEHALPTVTNLGEGTQYLTLEQTDETLASFSGFYRSLTQKNFVCISPRDTHL